ncbi:MAG: ATP-binding protein [Pseudomonadota bacterium]|jgi:signal transduction histidine kinase
MEAGGRFTRGINLETINSYVALAAAFINFTFALLAVSRTSRETVYTTFALVCLGVAWWNFCDFMVFATGHPIWMPTGTGHTTLWKNLVSIGSCLAAAALFHFTMAVVDRDKTGRPLIVLAYTLAIPLGILPSTAHFSEAVNRFWVGPWWNLTFFTLLFPFLAASIVIIARAYRRSKDTEEKGWLRFILIAMIIQVFSGMTDLFHKLAMHLPPLGHLGSTIGPSILAAGVYRYRKSFDILAQAQRKLELISETAAQVAHEVRNPLTAIKGLLKLLADSHSSLDSEKTGQYMQIMGEESERIENILNNLQDLTRPLALEMEETDVNDVLVRTVRLVQLQKGNLDITFNLDEDLPPIEADPSLLKQVFLNLIGNASDACGNGGLLDIRTSSDRRKLEICFSDNGPGVPEEIRSRLFEPFFTTKDTGLGLGLVIVQRIIETHRGAIRIDSGDTGGTLVTVSLPF